MKVILLINVFLSVWSGLGLAQVIPGLSPSKPNRLLRTCMVQAKGTDDPEIESTYNNQPANSVNGWCRSYQSVTPCLSQYLHIASKTNPNDWYLNLVFNEEYANKTSKRLCSRLKKYGKKMGCLLAEINQAEKCVSMLTYPVATHLHKKYAANLTQNVEENTLRACLIPVTAARCLQQFFRSCHKGVRKLILQYFMLLSGKCLKIAKDHEIKEKTVTKQQEDNGVDRHVVMETKEVQFPNEDLKATSLVASISPEMSGDHVLSEPLNKPSRGWSTTNEDDKQAQFEDQVPDIDATPAQIQDKNTMVPPSNNISPTVPTTHAAVLSVEPNDKTLNQQTTPPVTIFKMKIIQTVLNSNVDQDSKKKIQHMVRVETPTTNNDISVNIEHTSKNIDNVGSVLQSSDVPNQDDMTRERVNRLDQVPPTIPYEDDYSSEEDVHEQVVAVMTPVPEMEIIHPNQEDEVKSILSVYDNGTLTKDSSSSEEDEIENTNTNIKTVVEIFESESEQSEEVSPPVTPSQTENEDDNESSEEKSAEIKTTVKSETSTKPPFRILEQTTTKAPNLKSTKTRQQKGSGSGSRIECNNVLIPFFVSLSYVLLIT